MPEQPSQPTPPAEPQQPQEPAPPVPSTPLEITSSSYPNGGEIPLRNAYTQQGGSNLSPELSITALPAETKSIAIVMDDEVAPCGVADKACVHWNVFNLPSHKVQIAEGENLASIAGVLFGTAFDGRAGYQGPNPPNRHTYKLTVYALDKAIAAPLTQSSYTRSEFLGKFGSSVIKSETWVGHFSPRP
ncbi:YbhB/YbcL family Raf kinase inhibitor-like protein [Pulveribacter suum]|uniref:YbhB/YbcL family Raf kinase inhibitor-like protein n=1 Tax=Pulveribacter suum TaxID=2116657 RepID=UPI0013009112|nr:YbhB/YbcL family Raf kinase inhibitor-like protein [Pulveribacter suum]